MNPLKRVKNYELLASKPAVKLTIYKQMEDIEDITATNETQTQIQTLHEKFLIASSIIYIQNFPNYAGLEEKGNKKSTVCLAQIITNSYISTDRIEYQGVHSGDIEVQYGE